MSRLLLKCSGHSSSIFPSGSLLAKNAHKLALNKTPSLAESKRAYTEGTKEKRGLVVTPRGIRRGRPTKLRVTSTLDPQRLLESDHMDLSGLYVATLWLRSIQTYTSYTHRKDKNRKLAFPFPSGTRGFLYYHIPKNLPPSAASIRFRVCESKDTFDAGHDLLRNDGTAWEINTWSLIMDQLFRPLGRELVKDGLLSKETIRKCRALSRSAGLKIGPRAPVVYGVGQPFEVPIGGVSASIYVASEKRLMYLQIHTTFLVPFVGERLPEDNHPEGLTAQLCFEYDSTKSRLFLRLLKLPDMYRGKTILKEGERTGFNYRTRWLSFQAADALEILRKSSNIYTLSHTG